MSLAVLQRRICHGVGCHGQAMSQKMSVRASALQETAFGMALWYSDVICAARFLQQNCGLRVNR